MQRKLANLIRSRRTIFTALSVLLILLITFNVWGMFSRKNIGIVKLSDELSQTEELNEQLQSQLDEKDSQINYLRQELEKSSTENNELTNQIRDLEDEVYWLECSADGILHFCNTLETVNNQCEKEQETGLIDFEEFNNCKNRKLRELGYGYVLDFNQ